MDKKYPVTPFGEKILVQRHVVSAKTDSGIIMPDSVTEQKLNEGVVLAHGSGGLDGNGNEIIFKTTVGDQIIFDEYAGTEIVKGNVNYLLIPESSIICTINE